MVVMVVVVVVVVVDAIVVVVVAAGIPQTGFNREVHAVFVQQVLIVRL